MSIEIDRPAPDVFAYVTDPTRFHEWQNGVVDGNVDSPVSPHRVLSRTTRRSGGANRRAPPRSRTSALMITANTASRLGLAVDAQFALLVLVNALVGGLLGSERTVLPVLADSEFGLSAYTAALT